MLKTSPGHEGLSSAHGRCSLTAKSPAQRLCCAYLAAGALFAAPLVAQVCHQDSTQGPLTAFDYPLDPLDRVAHPRLANCACTIGCTVGFRCWKAEFGGIDYSVAPGCNPTTNTCDVTARLPMVFPGNSESIAVAGRGPRIDIREGTLLVSHCGGGTGDELIVDEGILVMTRPGLFSCANPTAVDAVYDVTATACVNASCPHPVESQTVPFDGEFLAELFCEPWERQPPKQCEVCPGGQCNLDQGNSPKNGMSGNSGAGMSAGGGGAAYTPGGQAGATLRYYGGGVGHVGTPGAEAWRVNLGRYWSHDFAERIVEDPDESQVWLFARDATLTKFSNLEAGTGLRAYRDVAPSDEARILYFDTSAATWKLVDLDGDVWFFDTQGRWFRTEDGNENAWTGTYDGLSQLESVGFPDGQSESFAYDVAGRLASISRLGTNGSSIRTWVYEWSGPDLIRITQPDGRKRLFEYSAGVGYLTLVVLEASGASPQQRIERAWEYDSLGHAIRSWRGAAAFTDAAATDKWAISFVGDPENPTEVLITDPLGGESTLTIGRDTLSRRPKVLSLESACPTCGSPPNSVFDYDDPTNPLRPTSVTDGRGWRTDFTYDAEHATLRSRIDGANVVGHPHLPRITEWQYDLDFPGLVTTAEGPSPLGSPHSRVVTSAYSPTTGNLLTNTISGNESTYPGGAFSLTTSYSHNDAGQVLTIDPPGYGATDQTSFTYNVPNTNGMIPDTRTDPFVGVSQFGYDAFNRKTSVTDPSGVLTETTYDNLDRLTSVIEHGDPATTTDDRTTTFTYSPLGDLFCVKRPTGSGIQYVYDAAGRLVELHRGAGVTTPTGTSCLVTNQRRERRLWTLDGAGHHTSETLQVTTTAMWPDPSISFDAKTAYVYSTMCHLDRAILAPGESYESVTEYEYDCAGNLARKWDANHPKPAYPAQPSTTFSYDEVNRLESVRQPNSYKGGEIEIAYEYDVQDHLTKVTDGEGTVSGNVYSDRDLLTSQISEVSGTSIYVYNDHGELTSETDARGITATRTVDAADRLLLLDYPDDSLDTQFTWGTTTTCNSLGRLQSISRGSTTVDYCYDYFGETLSEGALTYTYDKNDNRLTTSYPGNLTATYTYDRMDRPISLTVQEPGGPVQTIVSGNPSATYKALGPLATLRFATTTARDLTRGYDRRYFPTSISLSGSQFSWNYTSDHVGNVTNIDDTLSSNQDRSFLYRDWQYYLYYAFGPWGGWRWNLDSAGNRTFEDGDGGVGELTYVQNLAGTGNTSELVSAGGANSRIYTFDDAGNLDYFQAGANSIDIVVGDDSRPAVIIREQGSTALTLTFDGRGFLSRSQVAKGEPPYASIDLWSESLYSSDGILMSLERRTVEGAPTERTNVLYFAGSPIALWKKLGTGTATRTWLVTDHLGTPAASVQPSGARDWYGGFEPFGRDWQQGTSQDASSKGILLRFPGQWDDPLWSEATLGADLYYNVHRWYEQQTGRYTSSDPVRRTGTFLLDPEFTYGLSNPVRFIDPLGLKVKIDDPGLGKHYDELKRCYPLFGSMSGHFESDSRTWIIQYVPEDRPYLDCQQGSNRYSDRRKVFVPRGKGCDYTKECIFHELYERWAIDGAGLPASQGGAGPADDLARHFEQLMPKKCCECEPD